jgi:enterochelin esterase family protein
MLKGMKLRGNISMKKYLLKCKAILQLEEAIKQYGDAVLCEFLSKLEQKGAPIIEDIENEYENKLVTFIYEGDNECKSVLFVPEIGRDRFKDNYKDFKMERILETNLWYITYEIEKDMRLMYFFSPNDPLDNDWNGRFANRLVHDKYNKNIFYFEDGDKGSHRNAISPSIYMDTKSRRYP